MAAVSVKLFNLGNSEVEPIPLGKKNFGEPPLCGRFAILKTAWAERRPSSTPKAKTLWTLRVCGNTFSQ